MTPLRPRAKPESAVVAVIRARLEADGWLVLKTHGGAFQAGLPDLFCARGGVQLWLEVKRPSGGRLTRAQRVLFPRLRAAGVPVYVVRGIEDLEAVLAGKAEPWDAST